MKYLVVVLVVFSLVINVSATDWYVSVNGDDDNNGTSTGNAWRTITHAVSEVSGTAGNPAVIHVGSGTFDRDNDEDFPIEIDSDQGYITIVGEGTDDTHIDASGGDDEDDYYVFEIDGAGEFILRYLHLEGGRGIVKVDDSDNGAIFENMSADEFVRNEDNSGVSAFQFNNVSGDVEFNNVEISGALDSRNGGAIRAESFQGDISIENSTFTECVAQWNNGGTIYIDDMEGDFSISGGTIVDSYTNDQGGAIFVEQLDGSFSVDDVTFTRPKARYNHGGAIYMNDLSGNFSVTNSSFVNSESDDKGGVIYANEIGGSFTLTNLDFTESIARYEEGGDIYLENCDGEVNIDGIDSDSPFGYSHGGSFFFEDIRDDITISNVTVWDAGDPICDGDDDDDDGEDDDGDDDDDDEDEDGGACTSDGFGGVFYFNHIGNANNSVTVEISNVEIGNCITAQSGGAFYFKDMGTSNNNGASIILSDIEVEGSTSRWEDGGAVYIENVEGPVTINNGVFTECFAQESGGAIYIRNVDELITLSGITISEGFSEYEYGGGIAILDAIGGMAFEDVVVSESRAFDHGGGIYINDFSESLSFDGVCVESSHSIWGAGGGIYIYVNSNHVDSLTIDHLALSENYVDDNHGGGMYIHSNQINVDTRISNFSVVENSSGTYGHGGGIYFYKVDNLFLTDGTLTGNTTGDPDAWSYKNGGGIYMYKINEVTMNNVVFWENEVQGDGGGLWARDIYNSFRLYDVIFYGNTAFRENNSNAGQGGGMYFERANA
ncbi:MAG: hypothetical protein RAP03_04390, partial [Candidatus Electryonea clarkiae]|nr:hypothetical protein [Candidatus Electryonea clarkiae]